MSFNPRARVGRDYFASQQMQKQNVSIHAPAWGATINANNIHTTAKVSIHAPAWGATPIEIYA